MYLRYPIEAYEGDREEFATTRTTRRAKKDHGPCRGCGQPITRGQRYERVALKMPGEPVESWKQHSAYCFTFERDGADDER